ncbi:hypothetical protein AMK59_3212 [Oryctes borbonicus]|uniref:Uncharacterized protein n=1 Tax=Oryctes borbonicus TaxID=1629725 RepID=A0A0T6B538_9SCAR|nr:hypothetical protein AMK59_3212 [Oryctes borbonicus]
MCKRKQATQLDLRDLCLPDVPSTKTYKELCKILCNQYTQTVSTFNERINFYEARQEQSESVNLWFARKEKLAVNCNFGSDLKNILKYKFVTGICREKILDRMCEEDPSKKTLEDVLDIAIKKLR